MRLEPYYDKILHVTGTFTAFMCLRRTGLFGEGWLPVAITVLLMQVGKTFWNYTQTERAYKPRGDWIANMVGWLLIFIYHNPIL